MGPLTKRYSVLRAELENRAGGLVAGDAAASRVQSRVDPNEVALEARGERVTTPGLEAAVKVSQGDAAHLQHQQVQIATAPRMTEGIGGA